MRKSTTVKTARPGYYENRARIIWLAWRDDVCRSRRDKRGRMYGSPDAIRLSIVADLAAHKDGPK